MDTEPSRRIGRYQLIEELGRGMMGVVYRAHDSLLDRTVALKTIQLAMGVPEGERRSFEERFFLEARSAARLSHPGIVVVHDVGRDPETGTLFMALEHLKGRTLGRVIDESAPLPWRQAARITARVAEALGHAHSEGVVHRDIKPANIMLLDSGEPKIMDFGVAKLATSTVRLTSTGQFFGTPLFMAPEQALGQTVDGRSDLFSLGTVAYEMLTAHRPFDADNVPRILTRVAYEEPKPPSSLVAGLPPALDDVIARALAKTPGDRYQRGVDLAEDLEDVVADRPPRHLTHWQPPQAGVQTQVTAWSPAPPPPRERPAGGGGGSTSRIAPRGGADWDSPEAALSSLGVSLRPERQRGRRRWRWRAVTVGLGLLAVLGFGSVYRMSHGGWPWGASSAGEPPGGPAVLPTPASAPTSPPASQTTPEPTPPPTPEPSPSEPASEATPEDVAILALDFDHHLKDGMLKVWIDRKLLLEQPLAGESPRKPQTVTLRKGYLKAQLEVTPGQHDIWVEVRWDDNIKSNGITTRFNAGDTRTLKVRVGRIRKNVSLEWV